MYILDSNFLTALPAIILGIICCSILFFLLASLLSKATGTSIRYRGGITYRGETIATPQTLDNLASETRKLFDKKYKIKKKIQEEFNEELSKTLAPIESKISTILSMNWSFYTVGMWMGSHHQHPYETELLKLIGKTSRYSAFNREKLSSEDLEKLKKINTALHIQKQEITAQIKDKYEQKIIELNKYL